MTTPPPACVLSVLFALAAAGMAAEEPRPTSRPATAPSPDSGGATWERASAPTITRPPLSRPVAAAVGRRAEAQIAGEGGVWQAAKAIDLKEGEARLVIGGLPLHLRSGSLVGADLVKSVGSDRIVLSRGASAASPAGSATVVVTFDAQGRSRVRVYQLSDPAQRIPREVR